MRHPESLLLYIQITLVGIPAVWYAAADHQNHRIPCFGIDDVVLAEYKMGGVRQSRVYAGAPVYESAASFGWCPRGPDLARSSRISLFPRGWANAFARGMGWLAVLALTVLAVMVAPSLMSWPVYKEERHPQE